METKNIFKKPSSFFKDIDTLREYGEEKGLYHGFESLDDTVSFKEGCTTIIYGAPYSGKSQFTFEILVNLSEYYGQVHAIYSPETGTKNMFDNAKDFVDKYFFIAEDYEGITVEDFFSSVESIEKEYNIKINNTVIDHMGLLSQELNNYGGREDKWISHALKVVNTDALKNNRHNIVVAHVISQKPIVTNGVSWFPPAHPREIAGGQNYFRLGQQIILVYRPPANLPDENGIPYEENAVVISVRKSKPKGIGRLGQVKIFYEWI